MKKESSTLRFDTAMDLINTCSRIKTHEEKLIKCKEVGSKIQILPSEIGTDSNYKFKFVWFNTFGFILLHIIGLSGAIAAILGYCKFYTSIYCKYIP
jgi:hypothetical protein